MEDKSVLVYDDSCIVCCLVKRIVVKFDFKHNIVPVTFDEFKDVLANIYGKEPLNDFYLLDVSGSKLYRARKAIPQIIRALLRR